MKFKDRLEFKNELDVTVVNVVKTTNDEVVFLQNDNNFVLNKKEQLELLEFLSSEQ